MAPSTKKPEPVRIALNSKRHLSGYHLTDGSAAARRVALLRAVGKGAGKTGARKAIVAVQRRVQVLGIFFKRSKPAYAQRALADAAYLSKLRKNVVG